MIIVYSKKNCPNCDKLKMGLDLEGIPYEVHMLEESPTLVAFLKGEGHRSVPQMYNSNGVGKVTYIGNTLVDAKEFEAKFQIKPLTELKEEGSNEQTN